MYKIVHISSGIVAATFNDKGFAREWIEDNSTMPDGIVLELYKIVRATSV